MKFRKFRGNGLHLMEFGKRQILSDEKLSAGATNNMNNKLNS